MPLNSGDKLGPYEILAMIGKGGMGEVYRAHDPRLRRDVAVKVSNAQFTERFTREARTIAQLNHNNIAHLYDVGPNYLVMEYVEGEDLKGPLSFDDALPLVAQLIDGIEAAHEKNIIHRDLKPANIKVTPEGIVKILDFGLAKAMAPEQNRDSNGADDSPTLTMGATQAGTILGTAAYMSPEQAKGKEADKRADIWSFGVVLYELLTGKRLFQGESAVEILGGVLNREPDISAAPARVHKLLAWCLEKDRKKRLAAIGDARRMLEQVESVAATVAPTPRKPYLWMGAAAAFAVAFVGALALWAPWRAEPLKPLIRLEVDLGADVSLPSPGTGIASRGGLAISPDGTRLAYVASVAGAPTRLYARRLDQTKAVELPGTEGAVNPFFSPDSQWIGFQVGDKLNKISVEGGAVVPIGVADIQFTPGADWGEDGSLLVGGLANMGMRRLSASGTLSKLLDLSGELGQVGPQFLPGGKFALFSSANANGPGAVAAVLLSGGQRKVLVRGAGYGRYLPSGHLVYLTNGTLFAVPFALGSSLDTLETRGTALPILDGVLTSRGNASAELSFSNTGTLVYRKSTTNAPSLSMTLQWIDAAGKRTSLAAKAGRYGHVQISPDGKRVAFDMGEAGAPDVWIYDPQRDAMTKLTFGGGGTRFADPVWTPDGRFLVVQKGGAGLAWIRTDGSGQPQPLLETDATLIPRSISPDGKHLVYYDIGSTEGRIHTVELREEGGALKAGKPERFFSSKAVDAEPRFSPDGRWIAYGTTESGRSEIVVRAFPPPASGQGGKWQVSTNGGEAPRWSPDGRELLYLSGDQVMSASYTVSGDSFVAGKPRVKLEKFGTQDWDVAPDGRILVLAPPETGGAPAQDHTVVFLFNFFDELRRRVPVP